MKSYCTLCNQIFYYFFTRLFKLFFFPLFFILPDIFSLFNFFSSALPLFSVLSLRSLQMQPYHRCSSRRRSLLHGSRPGHGSQVFWICSRDFFFLSSVLDLLAVGLLAWFFFSSGVLDLFAVGLLVDLGDCDRWRGWLIGGNLGWWFQSRWIEGGGKKWGERKKKLK